MSEALPEKHQWLIKLVPLASFERTLYDFRTEGRILVLWQLQAEKMFVSALKQKLALSPQRLRVKYSLKKKHPRHHVYRLNGCMRSSCQGLEQCDQRLVFVSCQCREQGNQHFADGSTELQCRNYNFLRAKALVDQALR